MHKSKILFVLIFLFMPVSAQSQSDMEVIESDIEFEPSTNAVRQTVRQPEPESEEISSEMTLPSQGLFKEQQLVELNYLIKQMIDQYEILEEQRLELDRELKTTRGQRQIDQNRLNAITEEMSKIREQTEGIISLNQQYSQQLVDIRLRMGDREKEYQLRIKELEDRIEEGLPAQAQVQQDPLIDTRGMAVQDADLMVMIDEINKEGQRLKQDTARVHYNMGNIYFHKGEFKKAVQEYKKALKLTPADPAVHFNLAFVSGEYLHDHVTAVKHYREYMLLNPDAADVAAVKKKLIQSELSVRVTIDSPIDTPELRQ